MVPDIEIWTILLPISNKNLRYRVAKRGKNVNIKGFFFDIEYQPSISGPRLGGKDMQILNIGPNIESFFFDIELNNRRFFFDIEYHPSISKAHYDDIE